jgi:hypothetical protein
MPILPSVFYNNEVSMSFTSFTKYLLTACFAVAVSCGNGFAEDAEKESSVEEAQPIRVVLNEDGALEGRVFAMLGSEEAPMVAKVSLASDGKTVASGETDVVGNFSFSDVEPGTYTMVGVSGEYVGDQVVVVTESSELEDEESEGVYTSLALQVAPVEVYSDAAYAGVPMDSFVAPVAECGTCGAVDTCNSCGVSSYSACGGCGGGGIGGGGIAGGSSLRRLALLGAAVAIPIAVSGGPASPAQ